MFFKSKKQPFCLIILDGWGIAPAWGGNAISQARTPTFDKARQKFPSTTLLASGSAVGLPTNSPGNSEAGHLNIGAGRVIHQDIALIDEQIESGAFFNNQVILAAIKHAREKKSNLHLLGLLSNTGTHSHLRHLYALLEMIKKNDFSRVFIHFFSDGRDSDPLSGIEMISEVEAKIKQIGIGQIASISGRFYAMDRDNRWGRVARAYNLLVKGEGNCYESPKQAFSSSYSQGITDEFIEPRLIVNKIQSRTTIASNDSIILFNFRSDRVREITRAFLDENIEQFSDRLRLKDLYFASFVIYDDNLLSEQVFSPEKINNPIGGIWSGRGLRQFHTAETEKYPHITYFINGGHEKSFRGEDRLLIPSQKKVKTYDLMPRMSAEQVKLGFIQALRSTKYDLLIVNFANPDMVGHTGNLSATVQAVEFVDKCLGEILDQVTKLNGTAVILADHGNAEQMVNPATGDPDTEHTTNPVPFIVVSGRSELRSIKLGSDGILASVTPTILDLCSIPKPEEVRNNSLVIREIIKDAKAADTSS